MPILSLIARLTAIWHINMGETTDKSPIIERRNVKKCLEDFFNQGPFLLIAEVADYVADNALGCPLDTEHSPVTIEEATRLSTLPGELTVEDVFAALKPGEEFDDSIAFAELCHRIGTALNIDTSDDETNPDYWDLAWHDGLTPYLAVTSSVDEPVRPYLPAEGAQADMKTLTYTRRINALDEKLVMASAEELGRIHGRDNDWTPETLEDAVAELEMLQEGSPQSNGYEILSTSIKQD